VAVGPSRDTYWNNGARKTVTDPASQVTSYTYDGQNRLETATTAAGVTSYTYWPDDLLKTVSYPSGVVATYGYDKADRLLALENKKDATVLSSYAYTYWHGNRKTQTEVNGTTETTFYAYVAAPAPRSATTPAARPARRSGLRCSHPTAARRMVEWARPNQKPICSGLGQFQEKKDGRAVQPHPVARGLLATATWNLCVFDGRGWPGLPFMATYYWLGPVRLLAGPNRDGGSRDREGQPNTIPPAS
jgi:YD repeat-containing protein